MAQKCASVPNHDFSGSGGTVGTMKLRHGIAAGFLAAAVMGTRPLLRRSGRLADYREYLCDDPVPEGPRVTFLGTTMALVDDGTTQILVDAFLTATPLWKTVLRRPVRTDRSAVDSALDRAGANRVKAILVSHSHHDHAFDVAYIARRTGAVVYGSPTTLNLARGGGVPESQLSPLVFGEPIAIDGMSVTTLRSRHSPGCLGGEGATIRFEMPQPAAILDYKEGGTFDFLMHVGQSAVLFKGSANWAPGALDGIRADTVFLGVATLGKAPRAFVDEYFRQTLDKVKPRLIIATHWNDFFAPVRRPLPFHRRLFDNTSASLDLTIAATEQRGIRLGLMDAFGTVAIG